MKYWESDDQKALIITLVSYLWCSHMIKYCKPTMDRYMFFIWCLFWAVDSIYDKTFYLKISQSWRCGVFVYDISMVLKFDRCLILRFNPQTVCFEKQSLWNLISVSATTLPRRQSNSKTIYVFEHPWLKTLFPMLSFSNGNSWRHFQIQYIKDFFYLNFA